MIENSWFQIIFIFIISTIFLLLYKFVFYIPINPKKYLEISIKYRIILAIIAILSGVLIMFLYKNLFYGILLIIIVNSIGYIIIFKILKIK